MKFIYIRSYPISQRRLRYYSEDKRYSLCECTWTGLSNINKACVKIIIKIICLNKKGFT